LETAARVKELEEEYWGKRETKEAGRLIREKYNKAGLVSEPVESK
jgi:hypothetical protein